jgi:hypothetical protein
MPVRNEYATATYTHGECAAKVIKNNKRTGIARVIHLENELMVSKSKERVVDA